MKTNEPITQAEKDALIQAAVSRSRNLESVLNVHEGRAARTGHETEELKQARKDADEAREALKEVEGLEVYRDLSGVRAGLTDSAGNFAQTAEVAVSGGIGVEGSNSKTGSTEPAKTADEAGTAVGGAGGSTANPDTEIPANWQELTWPELRSLASNFDPGVRSKDDAEKAINKELKKREAAK